MDDNHYLNQAKHNQDFHDCITEKFSDKFYDWRITVVFYTALHFLKALAKKRNINIGETHHEIEFNVNPRRSGKLMEISQNAWREYHALFQYSRTARYDGITDFDTYEKLKCQDYIISLACLEFLKKYFKGQGLKIGDKPMLPRDLEGTQKAQAPKAEEKKL